MRMLRILLATAATTVLLSAGQVSAEQNDRNRDVTFRKPAKTVTGIITGEPASAANQVRAVQTKTTVGNTAINIAQPTVPDGVEVQSAQPIQQAAPQPQPQAPAQTRAVSKPVKAATRTESSGSDGGGVSEAKWWTDTGNPKVFSFSNCIAVYARQQAQAIPKVNLRSIVAKAIKTDCNGEFASMSNSLAERFGNAKSNKIAKELTGSTFVPAVREAVLKVRDEQRVAALEKQAPAQPAPAQPAPAAVSANALSTTSGSDALAAQSPLPVPANVQLELSKEEMFTCYRDTSDRVGVQSGAPVDVLVDQVLLDCSDNTRAFFDRLFALYPHSPDDQAKRMREAVANNYRPAIAKRIAALKTAGGTVPKQRVTSTGQ